MKSNNKKDADPATDRSLLGRLAEAAIVFAISCYLVRLGVEFLISVKIPLAIIAAIVGTITIIWRVHKWRDHDDY